MSLWNRTLPRAEASPSPDSWARARERAEHAAVAEPPANAQSAGRVDLAERLPEAAYQRLVALQERLADARAILRALADAEMEARGAAQRARLRIDELRSDKFRRVVDDDHPSMRQARSDLVKAEAEIRRLGERRAAAEAPVHALGGLLANNLEAYVKRFDPGVLRPAPATAAKPAKGETIAAAVDRVRETIAQLRADRHEVESAPITSEDAKRKARATVDALIERGRPDVLQLIEHGGALSWPMTSVVSGLNAYVPSAGEAPAVVGNAQARMIDAAAMLAWLNADALRAAVDAEVDAVSDDGAALDDKQRATLIAEIEAKILSAEREEASLVELSGGAVLPRPDIDPRAFLGVVGPAPAE